MNAKIKLFAVVAAIVLLPSGGVSLNNKQTPKTGNDSLKKTEHIIEISSLLTIKGSPAGNYSLFLSLDGNTIDTIKVEKARPIFFDLEQNKLYGLVFIKEGYPDKIVIVDTSVPDSLRKSRYFSKDIEIELDNSNTTQRKDFMDFPVAVIGFNLKKQNFDYGRKYYNTVHIK